MITIEEVGAIVADFVRLGYNAAVADYDPPQDKMRLAEVRKWLSYRRIELKTFQRLEREGLIHARKAGSKVNSPLVYSKAEIQKALATLRLNRIFVREDMEKERMMNEEEEKEE